MGKGSRRGNLMRHAPRQAGAGGTGPGQPPIDLLRPFPAEQMIAWKVDKAVGNVGNDSEQLLEAPSEEPMLGFVADPQQP